MSLKPSDLSQEVQTCEFGFHGQRRGTKPVCGKPAWYSWSSGYGDDPNPMLVCKEHGEQLAGNFKSELRRIK
jgi:hypothetical protein